MRTALRDLMREKGITDGVPSAPGGRSSVSWSNE